MLIDELTDGPLRWPNRMITRTPRCHCSTGWEDGPCDVCQGYVPCEGGCGEYQIDCTCKEAEDD